MFHYMQINGRQTADWASIFTQNANITRQKKATLLFFWIKNLFFRTLAQRTNASSNHDGRVEQTSRQSPTTTATTAQADMLIVNI